MIYDFIGFWGQRIQWNTYFCDFVIRGQFHPKRSPKGHLKVIGGCFSGLAPFYDLLINSRMILENIYGLRRKKSFQIWYSFQLLDYSSIIYDFLKFKKFIGLIL